MKQKVINALMFKVGWFSVVLLGTGYLHWIAPFIVLLIVGLHLSMCSDPKNELKLILVAIVMGAIWESYMVSQGILVYTYGQHTTFLAPAWIIALWALLATSLNVSLSWLKERRLLTLAFGVVGGPFAFVAGEKLGAVAFPDTTLAITHLVLGWGVLMLTLVTAAKHLDGYNSSPQNTNTIFSKEIHYET